MSFLKDIFNKKETKIQTYSDFWDWFRTNEKSFYKVVKNSGDFEGDFFSKLAPKLNEIKEGFYYLTGMFDETTAELVFTADGKIKNFIFIEELVHAAPDITGWKFTAHKPALNIENVNIEMADYTFSQNNLSFYPTENSSYPDEIEINVVHSDLTDFNRDAIANGIYIFLDNFLGEMNFATVIDYLSIDKKENAPELIPIHKLKDYLTWRQKEFIEKYEGIRHQTENDNYGGFEAPLENGNMLIAIINTDLLVWDSKGSHPWILKVEITYGDSTSNNGMPDDQIHSLMNDVENEINAELKDFEGYLKIGRQTANGVREIYYTCKDFRNSSKVIYGIVQKYGDKLKVDYDIFKDKYWRSFDRFST